MKFRPCIDLRNGKVTQIVGSTLKDKEAQGATEANDADVNFVSEKSAGHFADLYKKHKLVGGHIIMLGPGNEAAALEALKAYPGALQVGGGITPENAQKYLDAGASHVIVTSYVFRDGKMDLERLDKLVQAVGEQRLVLDLSCRKKLSDDGTSEYYVVTDRWQKYSDLVVNQETMTRLAAHCAEFLVHGVDVEGKRQGIEEELVQALGRWATIPVTYAGGVRSFEDLKRVSELGKGKVDITVGSALDIFGGDMSFEESLKICDQGMGPKLGSKRGITQVSNVE